MLPVMARPELAAAGPGRAGQGRGSTPPAPRGLTGERTVGAAGKRRQLALRGCYIGRCRSGCHPAPRHARRWPTRARSRSPPPRPNLVPPRPPSRRSQSAGAARGGREPARGGGGHGGGVRQVRVAEDQQDPLAAPARRRPPPPRRLRHRLLGQRGSGPAGGCGGAARPSRRGVGQAAAPPAPSAPSAWRGRAAPEPPVSTPRPGGPGFRLAEPSSRPGGRRGPAPLLGRVIPLPPTPPAGGGFLRSGARPAARCFPWL